ncbi:MULTISPECIES: DUF4258 domain-containing protein [Maribacter]|uniref:DUF4258 domain-containing protein n=2 Tax=Maribacter flavus TaxID=1658664 RepID=A0ABU7IIJ1_9FLAO|nr:DUF4258 domain-containing protein [Maribacter sp. PR66]MEE1972745.1 DUF4258 domain-containing protein [Maribacter flavus]
MTMSFLKRLGFYLGGFAIGIIFLAMFLRKKSDETGVSFCYFPNCRTLKDIRSKSLYYSDAVQRQLSEKELDTLDIVFLLNEGTVDFSKSDTKSTPCKTYFIKGKQKDQQLSAWVKNCSEKASIESVSIE